jgi:hypothetical protein
VNEKFLLIDKTQKEMVIEGNTKNVRTWVVQRVVVEGDSIMTAEIDDRGCGCGIITDEKWKERNVGDTLFFEYIRKERFVLSNSMWWGDLTAEPIETQEASTVTQESIINLNSLEIERRILEIERQILSLERELEKLKQIK